MEFRVQQPFESITPAANTGMVEFDFAGAEYLKEGCHEDCVLCGLTRRLMAASTGWNRT
jgi:hypothetical protein